MSNKLASIITVMVALCAAAAIIFTVVTLYSRHNNSNNGNGGFVPDAQLQAEVDEAAGRLVIDNIRVFKLFYTKVYDMPAPDPRYPYLHLPSVDFEDEPYNHILPPVNVPSNPPATGEEEPRYYYTLKNGVLEFDTVDELFELVDNTFVADVAESIKNATELTQGRGPVYAEGRNGKIGVNALFQPMEYHVVLKSGSNNVELEYISETECVISVHLTNPEATATTDEADVVEKLGMLKGEDGVWRLENIFY